MADDTVTTNGVAEAEKEDHQTTEEQTAEDFYDPDQGENETKLRQRIEALEQEKLSLVRENKEAGDQVAKLTAEIEFLRSEEEEMRLRLEIKRVMDVVSARAAELETQVARLQHDLISAMSDGQEASAEAAGLKKALAEKDGKLEEIKKEKAETDRKVRELERKLGVLEMKESEEKSKRLRVEDELREKNGDKDKELCGYKRRIAELEEIVRATEGSMEELKKQTEAAQSVIAGLKEKTVEVINGIEIDTREKKELKRGQLPVVAVGSAGAVVVAATLVYLYCARRK
ncbi:hypothetical protein Tsubulata_035514 [Turnera subulata]|uniref:Peroxisomal and mitochondrial division factor 2-like n=1 Tax=Turnera subulata TaxID=218843 RepID=A0A9Q0FGL4_9ROSI|nr:hypothetical protein Tsubulata_035514 [Turnera subulata]